MTNVGIGSAMDRLLQVTLNGCARVDALPDNLLLLDYLGEHAGHYRRRMAGVLARRPVTKLFRNE
jgi:hypothetical protein